MSSYIPVPVETEPVDLAGEAFDYLGAQVPESIFAYYGSSILGLPPYPAVQATAITSWTMVDAAGYTVDAGTVIAVTPPASADGFAFAVESSFTVPPGATVAPLVECRALQAGAAASGISGAVTVIDQLSFVQGVTLAQPTSGGQDAETIEAYLSRLSALLTLLTPRPILPQDFALLAQRSVAGVARATAIDLYNPGPPVDTNCPRCVTVVGVDSAGNALSATVKQEVLDLLQSEREVNFLVFVLDPTYTTIDVSFDVRCFPGWDPADVHDRTVAALESYLSPAQWGVPPFGDTSGVSWINDTVVRYLEVAEQINRVDGVHFINTLAIGVSGGALGQADVALSGVAPMPKAGAIAGVAHPA